MSEIDNNLKFYQEPKFVNALLLGFNITFFILKLIFGLITNSIALQADAFDSLTDIVMCLTALIGILFANKKPNEKFPYGYYKIENIISLIISLFIFFTAYIIIIQSITEFINFINGNPRIISFSPMVFLFLILSLFATSMLTIYLKFVGKRSSSPILQSEADEKQFDILISLSVLIGFICVLFNLFIVDSIIGLIIAIFIIKGGYDIFIGATKTLLDAVIDYDDRTELYQLIESYPKIKKIKKMEIRSYGKYVFLELEICLSKDFPLKQINALTKKLKNEIKGKFELIFKVIIIIHSQEKALTKIAVPLESNQGLNSKIAEHFGESPYFGLLEFQDGNFVKSEVIVNKFAQEEKRKGLLISDWLISEKSDKIYLKKELKQGPSLIFSNNFVEIELTTLEYLHEIIDLEKNLFS